MFKIFTVLSLLTLLSGDAHSAPTSPWAFVLAALVMALMLYAVVTGLRRGYRIVRKNVRIKRENTGAAKSKPCVKTIDPAKVKVKWLGRGEST